MCIQPKATPAHSRVNCMKALPTYSFNAAREADKAQPRVETVKLEKYIRPFAPTRG